MTSTALVGGLVWAMRMSEHPWGKYAMIAMLLVYAVPVWYMIIDMILHPTPPDTVTTAE